MHQRAKKEDNGADDAAALGRFKRESGAAASPHPRKITSETDAPMSHDQRRCKRTPTTRLDPSPSPDRKDSGDVPRSFNSKTSKEIQSKEPRRFHFRANTIYNSSNLACGGPRRAALF